MEERIKSLEERVSKLEENKGDIKTMVAVLTEKLDNIVRSIDKLSLQYERNVAELNAKYEALDDRYDKLKAEINDKTIGKDADKWNKIVIAVITSIIGIILGLVIGKI